MGNPKAPRMKIEVLCCGDRHWKDIKTVKEWLNIHLRTVINDLLDLEIPHVTVESKYIFGKVLKFVLKKIVIVHGDADGADRMCGKVGKKIGFTVKPYPAEWTRYGKAAGPMRNAEMLRVHDIKLCLAFHGDIKKSKGTYDMICKANDKKIPVILIPERKVKE